MNALLRRYAFSDGMLREWQRHQVEEVGLLPHFLPHAVCQRNDRNIYHLPENEPGRNNGECHLRGKDDETVRRRPCACGAAIALLALRALHARVGDHARR